MNMLDEFTDEELDKLRERVGVNSHSLKAGDHLINTQSGLLARIAFAHEEPWSTPIKKQIAEFVIKTETGEVYKLLPHEVVTLHWQLLEPVALYCAD